jgi:outer membrane lipoprotein-sorting protein
VHLQLTPKPDRDIDLTRVNLWYDRETLLPQRAVTVKGDEGAQNKSIVTLLDVTMNAELEADAFDTAPPQQPGWDVEIKRLKQSQSPTDNQ